MSTVRTLITINIIVGTTLLIGFVNNVAIASFFGLTRLLDAYFAAFSLLLLFMILFVDYLGKNFLPMFSEVRNQGIEEASELTSSVINIVFIIAIIFAVSMAAFSRPIFSVILPGFSKEDIENATKMFRIMSPAIVFWAVNTFHEYVWQYREKYVRVVIYKMALPATILVAILSGKDVLGEYSLAIGFLGGHMLIFLLLAFRTGYHYRLTIDFRGKAIRRIFVNSGVLMTTGFIARSRVLIERFYGSTLDPGAIAGISMASKLCEPLHQNLVVGVKMLTFTKSAKLVAKHKLKEMGELYNVAIITVLLFAVPISVWMGLNSDEIITVVFTRGKFDEQMHSLVTFALIGLVPSIMFLSVNQLLSNCFYVMNKTYVPALVMPMGTVIYLISIGVLLDEYGIFGLAVATTMWALFIFCVMTIMLGRTLERFSSKQVFLKVMIYTTASVFAFSLAVSLAQSTTSSDILRLLTSFISGIVMYTGLLALIRDPGFLYVKDKILQRKRR